MYDQLLLIPALPLAGFLILLCAGKRLGEPWAGWLATAMVTLSFVVTAITFFVMLGKDPDDRVFTADAFTWLDVGGLKVSFALLLDPLSITMALFVTGISALIHLYSVGYMHGDERYPKFFLYLNLFVFSMLMLVLSDSFLGMFLGWEGVGACSYFLIAFWFERESAASAGKKAFVTNRIGDFGFLLAMFLLFSTLGSLQYTEVLSHHAVESIGHTTATAIVLLFFLGAMGKSAQLPLYVWLPDAMEGPTPVSALIHAATMVTAGVYLMVRLNPILHVTPGALTFIAIVGAATALFAATVACAQNDIKRVLAYSTVSQLGYMFLAVGSGAYVAAVFHMVTHAFFKALLFLGSGSVIHGMHDEQNMKWMGALRKLMPFTSITFLIGWLAIAGIPPFAGFWSKDAILAAAYDKSVFLWAVGVVTALLTAYYMTRQVMLVFFGDARWPEHEGHKITPHESPWTMTTPLVVLGILSVFGGILGVAFEPIREVLGVWLEPVVGLHEIELSSNQFLTLALIATATGVVGIGLGYLAWRNRSENPALEPPVLQDAWHVNAGYAWFFSHPGAALAKLAVEFDRRVIDGAVNGVGTLVRATGSSLRTLQTGYVRNYSLGIAFGTVALLAFLYFRVTP